MKTGKSLIIPNGYHQQELQILLSKSKSLQKQRRLGVGKSHCDLPWTTRSKKKLSLCFMCSDGESPIWGVTGCLFPGHATLLHIPDQPCEIRKGWGKQTPSAELCKQQLMVTDCLPAVQCSTPLTARLWAGHTQWLKTVLLTIIRVITTIPRRDLTECLAFFFFLLSHFSSLQGTTQERRQLNCKANLAENTRYLLHSHRRQQILA